MANAPAAHPAPHDASGGIGRKLDLQGPVVILAALAAISGALGSQLQGTGTGEAPHFAVHMPLTGLWFGLVIGFGIWRWGERSWTTRAATQATIMAIAATWVGWELAVNVALQLEENWLKATVMPASLTMYVSGFAAGAVGAGATWAGAAASTIRLRRSSLAATVIAAGALLGLLLPLTNHYDHAAIVLVPWQITIAALIGFRLR